MNKEKSKCCGATKGERPYYGEKGVKTIFQFCTSCGQKFYPTMNNTLKQLQEKGEEEFNKEFITEFKDINGNLAYIEFNDVNIAEDVKNFLHQQTTLAYNAGKADMLDKIAGIRGFHLSKQDTSKGDVLDSLHKLLANKE